MSKIKKALERSKALREQNAGALGLLEREQPTLIKREQSGLSEREQLEHDIRMLLAEENPEALGSMRKEIKLSYSKTRTQRTDRQSLMRNRLFALDPSLEITKRIEILRTQVLKKLKKMNVNSLMVTSANPGEGKTFICSNLAVSITQNFDRTVMMIDADLRNRSGGNHHNVSSVFFNSNRMAGLSDYLSGKAGVEEFLINPGIPRFTILPSGNALSDSASLLGSPKMESLVHEMKSRFRSDRILIFDCCSCLSNADPLIMSKFVDAVLLVVENERTETAALQRMVELLKDKPIIGTVINKSRGHF
jgi:protein-tyrosine kinase